MATHAAPLPPSWHLLLPPHSTIPTDYGLGELHATRADGFLDVSLPFGRAFLRPAALSPLPPGARVSTDFGRGCLLGAEVRPGAGLIYHVSLLDCNLANGGVARGSFNVRSVAPRKPGLGLTFGEGLADADAARVRGNAAFTAGAMQAAIEEYQRSQLLLQEAARSCNSSEQREAMREKFTTCASNLAKALLREGKKGSCEKALLQSTEVRNWHCSKSFRQQNLRAPCFLFFNPPKSPPLPPRHLPPQAIKLLVETSSITIRQKLHLSRARALLALGSHEDALAALKEPCLAGVDGVAAEAAKCREAIKAAKQTESKAWGAAFGRGGGAASPSGGGGGGGSPGGSSPSGTGKHVTFGQSPQAVEPSHPRLASPRSPQTGGGAGDGGEGNASPLHRAAGHTPHPRKTGGGGEEEGGDGEEEGAAGGGASPKKSPFRLRGVAGSSTALADAEEEEEEEEGGGSILQYAGWAAVAGVAALAAYAVVRSLKK